METGWSGPVRNYQCHAGPGKLGCGHTAIRAEQVEEYVVEDALRRAERVYRKRRPEYETQQSALTSLRTVRETMAQLAVSRFVHKELTDDEYTAARLEMLREIEAAELHIALFRSRTPKTGTSGLPKRWANLTHEEKRSALADMIAEITILPRTRMRGQIDYARVRINYRSHDDTAPRDEKARLQPARRPTILGATSGVDT
jgi:hypothetical protein